MLIHPTNTNKSHAFWKGPLFEWRNCILVTSPVGRPRLCNGHFSVTGRPYTLRLKAYNIAEFMLLFAKCRKLGELSEISMSATHGGGGKSDMMYARTLFTTLFCPSINTITDFGLDSCSHAAWPASQQSIMICGLGSINNQLFSF